MSCSQRICKRSRCVAPTLNERNRTGVPQDAESAGESVIGVYQPVLINDRVMDLCRAGGTLRQRRGCREAEAPMLLVASDSWRCTARPHQRILSPGSESPSPQSRSRQRRHRNPSRSASAGTCRINDCTGPRLFQSRASRRRKSSGGPAPTTR